MPATTIVLHDHDSADKTFTLVGATASGALYKDGTRALSLPKTLGFQFTLGAPGSKANDKLVVTIRDSVINSTTKQVSTATAKLELSIPRDSDAWSGHLTEDLMAHLSDLLSVSGTREELADAMVPSQITP